MGDFMCDKCGGSFASEEGLASHKKDKHPALQNPQAGGRNKRAKMILVLIAVALLMVVGYRYYQKNALPGDCLTIPAEQMDIGGHQNLAVHIHPELEIVISGEKQVIPANIGVSDASMRPIHTHQTDGVLHIEAPCQREFTLPEFFAIWGEPLNRSCIFSYCSNETHTLKVSVNGEERNDFMKYLMRDGDKIVIEYSPRVK